MPMPSWTLATLEAATVDRGIVNEGGQDYVYLVMRKDFGPPKLPNFVGPSGHYGIFLISEETPVEFREYIIRHEIFCTVILAGQKGRCVRSLKMELDRVPKFMLREYIEFRYEFYNNLVVYHANSKDEGFKAEIRASLEVLRKLVEA